MVRPLDLGGGEFMKVELRCLSVAGVIPIFLHLEFQGLPTVNISANIQPSVIIGTLPNKPRVVLDS